MKPNTLDSLGFKFKVGEIVCTRASLIQVCRKPESLFFNPTYLVITGRTAHECSGGVQLTYEGRLHNQKGDISSTMVLHECELTPLPTSEAKE